MTARARLAEFLRDVADVPPDLLRMAILSAAAVLDGDEAPAAKPARKSKPRRRRTVTPHPTAGFVPVDDLARERARRMVGK